MFVCYLDDSDADQSAVVTMAGYVASEESWQKFERAVAPIFAVYGVTILHALEFHATRGEFKGWSQIRKNSFVDEIYSAVVPNIPLALSRSLNKANYKRQQTETGLNQSMSAYGVAFATILHGVARGNSLSPQIQREGVSFVVEAGHKNNSEISQYFEKHKRHEMFDGFVRDLKFSKKEESKAIQLADFFAFYSRREAALASKGPSLAIPRDRIYRRFAERIPHHCIVGHSAYKSKIGDWRDADFVSRRPSYPLPSEQPIIPKKTKGR